MVPEFVTASDRAGVEQLVEENLPLVGYHVNELMRRIPSSVDKDELASAGSEALVKAVYAFDESLGVPFARYAALRIRGAMLDELRGLDWMSRGARSRARRYTEVVDNLTGLLGRPPSVSEIADAMGVESTQVRTDRFDASRHLVSLDVEEDSYETLRSETLTPGEQSLIAEKLRYLDAAIDALPDRLKEVMIGLYRDEITVKELSKRLGVTQSRISQLRSQALELMRDGMNASLNPELVPDLVSENTSAKQGVAMRRRLAYYADVARIAEAREANVSRRMRAERQLTSVAAGE